MSLPKPTLKSVETPYLRFLENIKCLHSERNIVPELQTLCTGSTRIKTSLKMFKLQGLTKFGYLT